MRGESPNETCLTRFPSFSPPVRLLSQQYFLVDAILRRASAGIGVEEDEASLLLKAFRNLRHEWNLHVPLSCCMQHSSTQPHKPAHKSERAALVCLSRCTNTVELSPAFVPTLTLSQHEQTARSPPLCFCRGL
jgi:hypothetical protein